MAAVQYSDFISVCRDGVEYKAFVGDLPFDGGGGNEIDESVEKRGDTMTGPLLLYALTPTQDLEAASKAYVDLKTKYALDDAPNDAYYLRKGGDAGGWISGMPLDLSTLPSLP